MYTEHLLEIDYFKLQLVVVQREAGNEEPPRIGTGKRKMKNWIKR